MFSELGLKLPASTVNRWVHATANALYPLYESQREAVMAGGYTQIDEVVWRIADRPGGDRAARDTPGSSATSAGIAGEHSSITIRAAGPERFPGHNCGDIKE